MSLRINWSKDGTRAYNANTGTANKLPLAQATMDKLDAEPWTGSLSDKSETELISGGEYICFNFPSPVTLDHLAIMSPVSYATQLEYSLDTDTTEVPGLLGTWVAFNAGETHPALDYYEHAPVSPVSTSWIRIAATHWYTDNYAIHLFGAYDNPRFELWDTEAIPAPITDPAFLDFLTAPSDTEYIATRAFTIRNNDTDPHTYTVAVDQQEYSDIPFVTESFLVSDDGTGTNQAVSLVTAEVPASGSSVIITIHAHILPGDNPGDGKYYPKVTVTEN